jgi:hypothetical protein
MTVFFAQVARAMDCGHIEMHYFFFAEDGLLEGSLVSVLLPEADWRAESTVELPVLVVSGVTVAPVWPPGSGPMAN